jgi:hypothetical protein
VDSGRGRPGQESPAALGAVSLIRLLLSIGALVLAAFLIATHGIRAILAIVIVVVLWTVMRSRAWTAIEVYLARLTGSRRRAYAVAGVVGIAAFAAVNLYQLAH